MEITFCITQTSFFKKKISYDIIIGDKLEYGVYGTDIYPFCIYQLDCFSMPKDMCVAFIKQNYGRGINLYWGKYDRSKFLNIMLALPALEDEILELFKMVKRISDYWKCEIKLDGKDIKPEDINEEMIEEYFEKNDEALEDLCNEVISNSSKCEEIECLTYPLVIGEEEAKKFIDSSEEYFKWLNDKQGIGWFYVTPIFTVNNETHELTGRYTIHEDDMCIFPLVPEPPSFIQDPEPLNCKKYEIHYGYIKSTGDFKYTANYNDFIKCIPDENKEYFDPKHICVVISEEKIIEIFKQLEDKKTCD